MLSNIAKAKAETTAGQGSKPEGQCKESQCCLPRFVLRFLTFPALSTQGMLKKPYGLTQIFCYYWSQMATIIT